MHTENRTGTMTDWLGIKNLLAGAIAVFSFWFNALPAIVQFLLWMVGFDFLFGVIRAVSSNRKKRFNFNKSWRSVSKKAAVFLIVGIAYKIEHYIHIPLASAVALFYSAHYGISALDNASALGLPLPLRLREALAAMEREGNTPAPAIPTEGEES